MKRGLYIKLAATGISKNRKLYFPYILTCICMVMMFYIITFLAFSREFRGVTGGESMQMILGFGIFVMAVFSLIFLYYTNSFLIRRRQREFGLYNILGMGKKNLVKILIWENILTAGIALVSGFAGGILLSKLAELLAGRILGVGIGFSLSVEPSVIAGTAIFFLGIFFLIMLRVIVHIYRSRPVELLRSENTGEKPPKANWILAAAGLVILCYAYYLAIKIEEPITAMIWFTVAVILVIAATYLLFIAGSVALCRILQKKKGYYYKTKHFVSLSSMVYRMKRNGAGLASICILSTMMLVTVSSTVCLYVGSEDSLAERYPRDITLNIRSEGKENYKESLYEEADGILEKHGAEKSDLLEYTHLDVSAFQQEDQLYFDKDKAAGVGINLYEDIKVLYIIPVGDYNRLTGNSVELAEDEALLSTLRSDYPYDSITLENCGTWKIKKQVSDFTASGEDMANVASGLYLFVRDMAAVEKIEKGEGEIYGDNMSRIETYYGFDLDCKESEKIEIGKEIDAFISGQMEKDQEYPRVYMETKAAERIEFLGLYGGLFFLGVLLGCVFLFGTVLIIYYKQISEGYEDQDRFDILMKVGMSRKEVRQSINSQVLTLFFLPLVMVGVHMGFAFPFTSKLLSLLGSTNTHLLILVTGICYLVFVLFYVVVYAVTSKSYYTIVSGKNDA